MTNSQNFTETTRQICNKPNETETKRHKLFDISLSNSTVLTRLNKFACREVAKIEHAAVSNFKQSTQT